MDIFWQRLNIKWWTIFCFKFDHILKKRNRFTLNVQSLPENIRNMLKKCPNNSKMLLRSLLAYPTGKTSGKTVSTSVSLKDLNIFLWFYRKLNLPNHENNLQVNYFPKNMRAFHHLTHFSNPFALFQPSPGTVHTMIKLKTKTFFMNLSKMLTSINGSKQLSLT